MMFNSRLLEVTTTNLTKSLRLALMLNSILFVPVLKADEPIERVPTDELVEGIKSSDGRWFEVEVIVFSRDNANSSREFFDAEIKNLKPKRQWDLLTPLVRPDLTSYLVNLPHCWHDQDPFNNPELLNYADNAAQFYQQFTTYQRLITQNWDIANELCLLPQESLPKTWQVLTNTMFESPKFIQTLPNKQMYKRPTGADLDDFSRVYLLAPQNLQLIPHYEKLVAKRHISPIIHMGWRLPGLPRNKALPVYIFGGKNYSDSFQYDGTPKPESLAPLAVNESELVEEIDSFALKEVDKTNVQKFMEKLQNGASVDFKNSKLNMPKTNKLPKETWQLDGTIKVHLNHYLYLDAKFNYREPIVKTINTQDFLEQETSLLNDALLEHEDSDNELSTSVVISAMQDDQNLMTNLPDDSKLDLTVLKHYPLEQIRRSYSGDLHYLDHPKFGIIFQIRKYRH